MKKEKKKERKSLSLKKSRQKKCGEKNRSYKVEELEDDLRFAGMRVSNVNVDNESEGQCSWKLVSCQ